MRCNKLWRPGNLAQLAGGLGGRTRHGPDTRRGITSWRGHQTVFFLNSFISTDEGVAERWSALSRVRRNLQALASRAQGAPGRASLPAYLSARHRSRSTCSNSPVTNPSGWGAHFSQAGRSYRGTLRYTIGPVATVTRARDRRSSGARARLGPCLRLALAPARWLGEWAAVGPGFCARGPALFHGGVNHSETIWPSALCAGIREEGGRGPAQRPAAAPLRPSQPCQARASLDLAGRASTGCLMLLKPSPRGLQSRSPGPFKAHILRLLMGVVRAAYKPYRTGRERGSQ